MIKDFSFMLEFTEEMKKNYLQDKVRKKGHSNQDRLYTMK